MLKNITIGQYYPADSVIHRLDPRTKLFGTIFYITVLFMARSVWGYVAALAGLAAVIAVSSVPPRYMLRGLRAIFILIIFTAFLNIFFLQGDDVLFAFGFIRVTSEGLFHAGRMVFRLILLICGSSVLTLTTTPTQFTDAVEFVLKPFSKIGLPAHTFAMMMTLTLGTIPFLLEDTDRIMKAQKARGADFDTGGLIKKAKSMVPLLVPLFVSSFRRADDLATGMESRCYRGGEGRTKMRVLRFRLRDLAAFGVLAVFGALVVLV
jgi:energy-coupling factor transport system permease protein